MSKSIMSQSNTKAEIIAFAKTKSIKLNMKMLKAEMLDAISGVNKETAVKSTSARRSPEY